jgi:hypothetical protein
MLMARTPFGGAAPASGTQFLRRCYSLDAAAAQEENPTPALSVQDMMPVENIRNIAIIGKKLKWTTLHTAIIFGPEVVDTIRE